MTVRAWHVVLPLTLIMWFTSTWGMAVVVYRLMWWAAYVLLGGLRNGVLDREALAGLRRGRLPLVPRMGVRFEVEGERFSIPERSALVMLQPRVRGRATRSGRSE